MSKPGTLRRFIQRYNNVIVTSECYIDVETTFKSRCVSTGILLSVLIRVVIVLCALRTVSFPVFQNLRVDIYCRYLHAYSSKIRKSNLDDAYKKRFIIKSVF